MSLGRQTVLAQLFGRLYDSPVIRNDLRGELVEEIVGMALAPEWSLCGGDWAGHDLEHRDSGQKIQVKQSAAKQSWAAREGVVAQPRFSIAPKTGRWERGTEWVAGVGRNADIFIFAWHPVVGEDCDHANPDQWQFYAVAEPDLPTQKSIGLGQVRRLATPLDFDDLRAKLATMVIRDCS